MSFKKLAYENMDKCCTIEDYLIARELLTDYGMENFYSDLEEKKIFQNRKISIKNNPFAQMIVGKNIEQFEEIDKDFILIDSKDNSAHKLLIPKILDWDCFNVLTLTNKHLELLKRMKKIAFLYAFDNYIRHFGLFFHCYPFNTVNALHLHIVDLDKEPQFFNKTNNLKIDDVIKYLEIS